ncbi:hypothetical protein BSL78_15476 [Apostichopus japonicus]|uniref:Uncharacterized protein n=1 Tax=Stichopus japonicus TaxID=307972 RepID=A0A2G8KI59_STIJA|nr:hypothetical protein BSL78_15476 [Apostichopus japonicus]
MAIHGSTSDAMKFSPVLVKLIAKNTHTVIKMKSRKPKLLLSVLTVLSCCSLAASFVNSGLITVVPVDEYVVTGSNFTIYCTINRTLTSDTSANLVWSKGYPPFTNFGSSDPSSGPNNITKIINETTMSITLLNLQPIHTAYYHCYLRGAQDLKDTDNCDIHVIDQPVALQHLTCGAFNVYSFYCSWERNYTAEYNATYSGAVDSFDNVGTRLMRDCENLPTPGVPEGYMKMCGDWRQHYEVRVSVKVSNPVGSSTTETTFNLFNEVKPLPVDNLIATSITASSAHLSGGPPPYYVETPSDLNTLNEYEISYTITGDEDWQTDTIGNDLSHTLVDLFPNTYYEVRVRSKPFVDNWSDWSAKTVFKTLGSIPTGSVTQVISEEGEQHSNKYSRTVTISWTGLTTHQEGADNFFYYVDLYDKQMQQVIRSDKTSHIAYTFQSISNFVSYDITVTPGNELGNATATTITVANKTGVPGIPKDLQWHPYNSTAGTFSWDDPDEPNGIIEKFKVVWWKKYEHGPRSQSHSGEVTKMIGEDHFSFTVTGLETYEDYIFSVCAVRAGERLAVTRPDPREPSCRFLHQSGTIWRRPLNAMEATSGDHNGNIIRYVIRYCHQEQMDQNCLSEQDSVKYFNCTLHSADELIKCTLGGLRPYTYYQLAIAAVAGEVGPYSIPKVAKTAQSTAGPPGNLIVSSVNSSFILAAWDAPLNMNGALDQYQVTCTLCKTSSVSVYGTSALLEVYGDMDVEVSVRACTQAAIRACGNHVGPHKFHTPISSASHPMNIAIPEVHDDKVVLTWDAPEHPNGPIKFYRVRYRKSSSNRWENYDTFQNKSATVHVDCGMGNENVYDFSVIAVTQNDTVMYDSEPAQVKGQELCAALTTWNTFALISLASVALLVLVVSLIVFIMYHQRVKKNLPDPYFIDSVKSSIYGQKTWTYNESQFFIIERESFDTLRCVDDSTQLLGLDRMYSTEGSTSSSDQGIHDMDGQQLTAARSCTRLVPEGKGGEEKADYKRPLRVLCQDLDKDQDFAGDDAVFPDDTDNYGPTDTVMASVSYASPARIATRLTVRPV